MLRACAFYSTKHFLLSSLSTNSIIISPFCNSFASLLLLLTSYFLKIPFHFSVSSNCSLCHCRFWNAEILMSDALVRCYLILYWVLPLPLTSVKGRTLITEVITESNQATQHNTDKRLWVIRPQYQSTLSCTRVATHTRSCVWALYLTQWYNKSNQTLCNVEQRRMSYHSSHCAIHRHACYVR